MSALEPGLYRATVKGVADRIVLVDSTAWGYYAAASDGKMLANHCDHITDARPLIVLDLAPAISALRIATLLRDHGYGGIADQIEAQTKPAKIEEPKQGERVEANLLGFHAWNQYLHFGTLAEARWVRLKDGNVYAWDQLTNPEVVTE